MLVSKSDDTRELEHGPPIGLSRGKFAGKAAFAILHIPAFVFGLD